jgi:hypothetical protein
MDLLNVPVWGFPTRDADDLLGGERRYITCGTTVQILCKSRGRRLIRAVVEQQIVYAWVYMEDLDHIRRRRLPTEGGC